MQEVEQRTERLPRRTLLRQWAHVAAMNNVSMGAMPPSPRGRHRAWRKRLRRWWPGDSEKNVHCGGLAPPFEDASPRKGVAPSPREPAANLLEIGRLCYRAPPCRRVAQW